MFKIIINNNMSNQSHMQRVLIPFLVCVVIPTPSICFHVHTSTNFASTSKVFGSPRLISTNSKNFLMCDMKIPTQDLAISLLSFASFFFLAGGPSAQAFGPDLSESPLKKAVPSIVVEGAARVVDGERFDVC